MRVRLSSSRTFLVLATISATLIATHVVVRVLGDPLDDHYFYGFGPLFNLDAEANLPTFYSTVTLLLAATVLAGLASCERDDRSRGPYWRGLAAIFAFLAVDEAAMLHELVGGLIEMWITTSGFFFYSWVVPYAGLLIGLALLYGRFLLQLPRQTCGWIVMAGMIYGTGTIGLEAIAARHDELYGQNNPTFTALATIEETLEMGGIAIFIYALLAYAEKQHDGLEITIGQQSVIK